MAIEQQLPWRYNRRTATVPLDIVLWVIALERLGWAQPGPTRTPIIATLSARRTSPIGFTLQLRNCARVTADSGTAKSGRLMSAPGQERLIWAFLGMSAVTPNADICLRRNI